MKLCYDGPIPKPTKQKHATKQKHRKTTNCRNKQKMSVVFTLPTDKISIKVKLMF